MSVELITFISATLCDTVQIYILFKGQSIYMSPTTINMLTLH